jgi:hypothetical protein
MGRESEDHYGDYNDLTYGSNWAKMGVKKFVIPTKVCLSKICFPFDFTI